MPLSEIEKDFPVERNCNLPGLIVALYPGTSPSRLARSCKVDATQDTQSLSSHMLYSTLQCTATDARQIFLRDEFYHEAERSAQRHCFLVGNIDWTVLPPNFSCSALSYRRRTTGH